VWLKKLLTSWHPGTKENKEREREREREREKEVLGTRYIFQGHTNSILMTYFLHSAPTATVFTTFQYSTHFSAHIAQNNNSLV
jgi:hypothetical protein